MGKPFRKITENEALQIVDDYNRGELINNICKKFNRDRKSIRKFLDIYLGKDRKMNYRPILLQEIENFVLKSLNILSIEKIAKTLNITRYYVIKIAKLYNITISDYRKYEINENYFENIDSFNKAYILGLLYADGCLEGIYTNSLTLKTEDKYLLEKINIELNYNKPLEYRFPKLITNTKYISSGAYKLSIYSKKMRQHLELIGLHPRKSLTLKFPKLLDPSLYSHFIRGYFDGDGHISKVNKAVVCNLTICGTFNFLTVLNSILKANDLKGIIHLENRNKKIYYLNISMRKTALEFADYIYMDAELYLDRKYKIFKDWRKLPYDTRKFKKTTDQRRNIKNDIII